FEDGIGGTHGQILQSSQPADDGIGNSDSPYFSSALPGEIAEREYGERPHRSLHRTYLGRRRIRGSMREAVVQDDTCRRGHDDGGSGEDWNQLRFHSPGWLDGSRRMS